MKRLLALLLLVPVLAACEETEGGITGPCGFGDPCPVDPVAFITIAAPDHELVPGDTLRVSATLHDSSGAELVGDIAFSSADTNIAQVDANGLVRAIGPGVTQVIATSGTQQASMDIEVVALLATGVSAGGDFACLTTNVTDRARCWGLGDAGQLGFTPDTVCFADDTLIAGTLGCAIFPRPAAPQLRLTSISAGDSLACGVDETGAAWCWGDDRFGQRGAGGAASAGHQRVIAPGAPFSSVSAGGRHACGIAAGRAYCWGEDSVGQLGDARRINSTTPIPVASTLAFTTITTGLRHTCALTDAGAAYCWGNNTSGQLGVGPVGSTDVPLPVVSASTYAAIAAGDSSTCAVRTDNGIDCWGSNTYGQLGIGLIGGSSGLPLPILGGGTYASVSVGNGFACAVRTDGAAYCWGKNDYGQLGSAGGNAASPRAVDGGLTFASISAGARHVCGVTTDGSVYCWGSNVFGALGDGLQAAVRDTPVRIFPSG
jgi:alpha-tubulin suppressor-like RCC1 family protein